MSVNTEFKSRLPIRIQILGRFVTFGRRDDGRISATVSEEATPHEFRRAIYNFDMRRGISINGPEERANIHLMEARLLKKETVKAFLDFYISQPVGVAIFVFDKSREFYSYRGRVSAVDEAILTWDALNHWDRTAAGKLKLSIPCCAYRSEVMKRKMTADYHYGLSYWLCSSNVSDPSGCCAAHKKKGARTLFNFYPYFAAEGFPELAQ